MNTKKICNQLGITQKLLRTYEDHGIISPLREENNYRDYSIDDVIKIKCIMLLRGFGFSYEQIRTILNESCNSGNRFGQTFYIQLKSIDHKIHELEETKVSLKKCINDFLNGKEDVGNVLTTMLNFEVSSHDPAQLPNFSWDFDNWADSYDEKVILATPEHQKSLVFLRSYILEHFSGGHTKVLDVGCGSCYLWRNVQQMEIIGMDNSLKMIFCAKENSPQIRFVLADILENDLPETARYGLVVSTFLLHHIPYRHQYTAVANMLSAVETYGKLILLDRMFYDEEDEQALRTYYLSAGEFRKINDMVSEYFPYANQLTSYFRSAGYHAEAQNVDKGVWMIIASKNQ